MKAVVLAYNNIGCEGIRALLENGFEIQAVFTHRDDPNENLWFESVAELASQKNLPLYAPDNINHPLWVAKRLKARGFEASEPVIFIRSIIPSTSLVPFLSLSHENPLIPFILRDDTADVRCTPSGTMRSE